MGSFWIAVAVVWLVLSIKRRRFEEIPEALMSVQQGQDLALQFLIAFAGPRQNAARSSIRSRTASMKIERAG